MSRAFSPGRCARSVTLAVGQGWDEAGALPLTRGRIGHTTRWRGSAGLGERVRPRAHQHAPSRADCGTSCGRRPVAFPEPISKPHPARLAPKARPIPARGIAPGFGHTKHDRAEGPAYPRSHAPVPRFCSRAFGFQHEEPSSIPRPIRATRSSRLSRERSPQRRMRMFPRGRNGGPCPSGGSSIPDLGRIGFGRGIENVVVEVDENPLAGFFLVLVATRIRGVFGRPRGPRGVAQLHR